MPARGYKFYLRVRYRVDHEKMGDLLVVINHHRKKCTIVHHRSTIGKSAALQAITIMNYVVDTKFAMMPPEEKLQDTPEPALWPPGGEDG